MRLAQRQAPELLSHPTPAGAKIYHWHGGLLLLAHTLVLDRPTSPIAATLRIALGAPYTIEVEGQSLTTRASLVNSKRSRDGITAIDSDLALFYLPIEWPEYAGLRRLLGTKPVIEFELTLFDPVIPRLKAAFAGELSGAEIKELAHETLQLIAADTDARDAIDARVREACAILAKTPLDQFSLEDIANRVHLSSSRLRKLFKQQIGYGISEYARWSATWQLVASWRADTTLTEAAIEAGFFDLAHADKNVVEVFGMSPSIATDARFVTMVNCD